MPRIPNNAEKSIKRFSCYFTQTEYEFITKIAGNNCLKATEFLRSVLLKELRKHEDPEVENPFLKKS